MTTRGNNDRHKERARKVVESFKALLDEPALQAITDSEFTELSLMIEEAIADELHNAAEMVDEVARRLRAESNLPELGI